MPELGLLFVSSGFSAQDVGYRAVCEDLAERLERQGFHVIRTSSKTGRISRLVDMVSAAWRRRDHYVVAQVDVFSGWAFLWAEAVCLILEFLSKPYILTLHGGNLPAFAARWPKRVKRLLKSAAIVTTPSRYLFEELYSYHHGIVLLPNPLNVSLQLFRLREDPEANLVWLRAFHSIYNPELAVKVIAQLVWEFPKIRLSMIGPDKGDGAFERVKETIKILGLTDRIALVGSVPHADVPNWLNSGDIFLNTTYVDNTPISVIEAMASGLCVVSTNVGGLPYLLQNEIDSLLVPPDNVDAMADAVRRILREAKLAASLSRNARTKAEQFDWSIILPIWENLLTSLVRQSA